MRNLKVLFTAALAMAAMGCNKHTLAPSTPTENATTLLKTEGSPVGDVVGKVTVGYQGWFSCGGDGTPINAWSHNNMENWPDMRQYATTYTGIPFYQAGVAQPNYSGNLGNGQQARMFTSDDQQVVNTHVLWMQQNGIDCIAVQRFFSTTNPGPIKDFHDALHLKVANAAQTYGRKFYIMYDCKATDNVEADWTNTIINTQHLTTLPTYAHQNGKPVVAIWGIGYPGRGSVTDWVNKINWFKSQGLYVIGCPGLDNFTTDTVNQAAYNACNMIMAWMVGKTAASNWVNLYSTDLAYCNAHGMDYQGDMYPGFAFNNTDPTNFPKNAIPRTHGDFMWSQFAGGKQAGLQSVYISMFDEMNEGTAVFNLAEDSGGIPAGKYFLTLDADGTHVSSDFYLRLINDGAKMIKGQIAYTATHPTPHVLTPPASLTPHVLSSTSIQINWSAVTDAPCYNVKRATISGGPYTTVAAGVTGGTFTNTGLTPNTTYYYVVSSGHINGGESINSGQVSGKTNP